MRYTIPGVGEITIKSIILDLNGTLTVGGKLVSGVHEKLQTLKEKGFRIVFFSGDTRGNAADIARELGIEFIKAGTGEEKKRQAEKLTPNECASIGNGLIDLEMMKIVKLSIVTLQAEGVHTQTLFASDIVVPTIIDALDLFIDQNRLIATLRK